jgi:hypothetical protein
METAVITVFNPAPGGGLLTARTFRSTSRWAWQQRDLIYDRLARRIYASIPAQSGRKLDSAVDPFTVTFGAAVSIGSEPGKLALSDNGQYLYVSLDGAGAVRRVDLASATPGLQFSLGTDPSNGPYYVIDMDVLPGNPGAVAVSRRIANATPDFAGVA